MKRHYLLPLLLLCILLLARCGREEADTSLAESFSEEIGRIPYIYPFSGNEPLRKPGSITAGEWNDLAQWHLWAPQLKKGPVKLIQEKWNIRLQNRYTLLLTDSLYRRIPDAKITLETSQGALLDEGRTDNTGRCYLFPSPGIKAEDLRLKIVYADQVFYIGDLKPQQGYIEKQLNIRRKVAPQVDLLLIADAGMRSTEEFAYLQKELKGILDKVKNRPDNGPDIRLGSMFYAQHAGKLFISTSPFTSYTLDSPLNFPDNEPHRAATDSLEAIVLALEEAVYRQTWSKDASSRLLFLLLDAPPHHDLSMINRIHRASREAARRGIRIIPVVTGHTNLSSELLLRSMAIRTNGTFIFVTHNPADGISAPVSAIGAYTEEPFNNLMLNLLVKYTKVQ
jgi:hypothetical protein